MHPIVLVIIRKDIKGDSEIHIFRILFSLNMGSGAVLPLNIVFIHYLYNHTTASVRQSDIMPNLGCKFRPTQMPDIKCFLDPYTIYGWLTWIGMICYNLCDGVPDIFCFLYCSIELCNFGKNHPRFIKIYLECNTMLVGWFDSHKTIIEERNKTTHEDLKSTKN